MKIEKYELVKKNKYNIFLSNGEVITLDERVITENELLLKKMIDKELYDKVMKENIIYNFNKQTTNKQQSKNKRITTS